MKLMSKANNYKTEESFSAETIIHEMSNLAYVFTKEGRLFRWNKNAELTTGYSKAEMHNKFVSEFIHEPDRERVLKEFMEVLAESDDNERTICYNLQAKSGELIPLLALRSYAVIDGKEYVIGIAIDLSKNKDSDGNLNIQAAEMKRLKILLEAEELYLKEEAGIRLDFKEIIGQNKILIKSLNRIRHIASLDNIVLLTGESGTGKELMARSIHKISKRRKKPFVVFDFASLPQDMINCELFGCEKGAISGISQARAGKIALAHHGTLFLNSIDKIPLTIQLRLLHMLQHGAYERIGDPQLLRSDVRIIAATSTDLNKLVEKKLFNIDLFYLLNSYPIATPPLRERISDIPLLVEHFVQIFNKKFNKNIHKISTRVIRELQNYSWPGNIRQLENIIERSVITSPPARLVVENIRVSSIGETFVSIAENERLYIIKVLTKTNWRINGNNGAAKILELHPETLRSRMRKLGVKRPKQ